jgi:hypothetical protein
MIVFLISASVFAMFGVWLSAKGTKKTNANKTLRARLPNIEEHFTVTMLARNSEGFVHQSRPYTSKRVWPLVEIVGHIYTLRVDGGSNDLFSFRL